MSERDGYEHGVPCWVDTWQPDAEAAVAFYTQLFGWQAEETVPPGSSSRHFMCALRDRSVAAIGGPIPEGAPAQPAWGTYVWVDDVDDVVAKVTEAGGSVAIEPFGSLDGGRMAIVADPAGAVLGLWQPGEHRGAGVVNEPGAWSMSALNTSDPKGAKAFYGAVFGWGADSFEMGGGEVALWRLPGFVGGEPSQPVPRDVVATMAPAGDDVPAHWTVDFWVDDADATAAKVTQLGGAVVVPPYDIPDTPLRQADVSDPQGASFSVTQLRLP